MARRYQSQPSFEGIDSNIYSGAERAADLAIARNPNAYSYSYGDLNEKYPISITRPINPVSIQEDIDEQELKRKTDEIAYKEKQYQMQLMDSQLNRENARLTQAPAIRKEISNLNPQSDDFEKQLIDIYQRNPIGYEDKALQDYIIRPLLNTHNQYIQNKNYIDRLGGKIPSSKDVEDASFKLMEYEDRIGKIQRGEIDDVTKQKYQPLSSSELMEYNFNKGVMQRAQSSYQGGDQQQTMQPQQAQPMQQQAQQQSKQFTEGKIYKQNGVRYKYSNGQFIAL